MSVAALMRRDKPANRQAAELVVDCWAVLLELNVTSASYRSTRAVQMLGDLGLSMQTGRLVDMLKMYSRGQGRVITMSQRTHTYLQCSDQAAGRCVVVGVSIHLDSFVFVPTFEGVFRVLQGVNHARVFTCPRFRCLGVDICLFQTRA